MRRAGWRTGCIVFFFSHIKFCSLLYDGSIDRGSVVGGVGLVLMWEMTGLRAFISWEMIP